MATFVLTTVGTTGDLLPYLALGEGLSARGHRVRIVSHAFHEERVKARGLEFVAEGAQFNVESFNRVLDEVRKIKEPLQQFELLLNRLFLTSAERRFEVHLQASKDADLVVNHGFDLLGQEAAIKNRRPWASVTLLPHLIPTDEAPVYPLPRLGLWWTKMTWKTLYDLSQGINRRTSLVLSSLGAAPRSLGVAGAVSPYLHLVAASPSLVHARTDWPSQVHLTGAFIERARPYQPPPELAAFLDQHPRPVVVTFGSMGGNDSQASNEIVQAALRMAGRPAIVQAGYTGLMAKAGPGDPPILSVGYVPHDFLFAQAGCVVHHAGAGTSTAATWAKVPSVAVPHLFDQYYWAGMLRERGLTPKPIFRSDLTAARLAKAIRAVAHPKYQQAAEQVGAKLRGEDGVGRAVELLEGLLSAEAPANPR